MSPLKGVNTLTHSQQMALIVLRASGFIDYLGYRTIFMHAIFHTVVVGQKKWIFPPTPKPTLFAGRR
jgi:hypothetical protein